MGLPGVVVLVFVASMRSLSAQESTATFKDAGEVAYVNSSGNTATETLSASNEFQYQASRGLSLTFTSGALFGRSLGTETAEQYNLKLRGDQDLSGRIFLFGKFQWDRNRFAGLENRFRTGGGAGYKWIKTDAQLLKTSGGFKYVREERVLAGTKVFPMLFLQGSYKLSPLANLKLGQYLLHLRDLNEGTNWEMESETFAQVALTSVLAVKIGYKVNYRNQPVPGFKRRDALASTALVFNL